MRPPELILASASPRRAMLLQQAGYAFRIQPADVEELADVQMDPQELCRANARLKAAFVAALHRDTLVLGCDTIVCVDGDVLGKPGDRLQAQAYIARLQGRAHHVMSGVSLIWPQRGVDLLFHVSTEVVFLPLSTSQIGTYLDRIKFMDKAGAYAAQEHADMIIQQVNGSFSNVVGLPMEQLAAELERLI
ncbi:MAG: Maf family protein [Verrucomicrobia bacterium]|nr:Maf family protein [Verrucomicrobiota bacterium]